MKLCSVFTCVSDVLKRKLSLPVLVISESFLITTISPVAMRAPEATRDEPRDDLPPPEDPPPSLPPLSPPLETCWFCSPSAVTPPDSELFSVELPF